MVDTYDWTEFSDFDTSFDYPVVIPDVYFPLPEARELHLNDKNCFTCKCKLEVPGLSNRKKVVCLFCYRASCPPCLGFYYFHSESSSVESMCTTCQYKLIDLHHSQSTTIEKLTLERIELRKQLRLATEQRKLASFERILAQKELESGKTRIILSSNTKKAEVFKKTLQKKQKDLTSQLTRLKQKHEDTELKNEILKKRLNEMTGFIQLLQEKKKSFSESEELRNELNIFYFKIAKIREKAENFRNFGDRDEMISEEIEDLELQQIEMNEISMNMSMISQDLNNQIKENKEKIESLEIEAKNLSNQEITEEQEVILKSLNMQVKELDDLIKLNKRIHESLNISEYINLKNLRSSAILDTQVTEENIISNRRYSFQGTIDKACINKCLIT
jgi:hypothetical protein